MPHQLTALQQTVMLTVSLTERNGKAKYSIGVFADNMLSVLVSCTNGGTISFRYLNQPRLLWGYGRNRFSDT